MRDSAVCYMPYNRDANSDCHETMRCDLMMVYVLLPRLTFLLINSFISVLPLIPVVPPLKQRRPSNPRAASLSLLSF